MRDFAISLKHLLVGAAVAIAVTACSSPPQPPMTWQVAMVRVQRDMGLRMVSRIRAAPQPAAAKDLLAPAITLLTRGQLYKEARYLAETAINTFPNDPLYHQLLGEAYQATIVAGQGSRRTEKKMRHEWERARELRHNSP